MGTITVTTGGPIGSTTTKRSILRIIQDAAPFIGLTVPSSVYSSADREHVELQAICNQAALMIAKAHEWEALKGQETYTGDGTTEDFDLPTDYDRMLTKSQLWSSALETPLSHIISDDEWLRLDVQAFDFVVNAWIKYGGQIHIKPAPADGVTIRFFYMNSMFALDSGGAEKSIFENDADLWRLDDELLKLAIVWLWKQSKGFPYGEDMTNYEMRKEKLISSDKGSRILAVGSRRLPAGVKIAYPQAIGT